MADPPSRTSRGSEAPSFSDEEVLRYSRHLILPTVGVEGQRRLAASKVVLVGAGGLGSPAALYLAAAGVGHLGLVDFDRVDLTNLHRQILHGTGDVGRPKLESARARLEDVNPHVQLATYDARLTSENALDILRGYDVVIDGTDNFPTRYLVNDACVLLGIPNVYGSIYRFEGQASVFAAPDGPCYRCLFPQPPAPGTVPSCAEGGVLGVLPGLIGTIQATEAIKLLLGVGETLVGRLLLIDALRMSFRTVALRRDPACPACGTREIRQLIDYEAFCGIDAADHGETSIEAVELAERLARGDEILLLDVRERGEWDIGHIAGARHVPLGTLLDALPAVSDAREVVVYCKTGPRSLQAARTLRELGHARVSVLAGGIIGWSERVDPRIPKY